MDNTFRTICIFDPALDIEKASRDNNDILHKFTNARDLSLLTPYLRPGQKPTYFVLRYLKQSMMGLIEEEPSESKKYERAFQYAVVAVEGLYNEDGTRLSWSPTGRMGEHKVVSPDELDRFSRAEIIEIGAVAYWRSFLPTRLKLNLRLPPTSADILVRLIYQSAVASQITAGPNNSNHSVPGSVISEPTGKDSGSLEEKSVTPMVAIAEVNQQ